MFIYSNSHCLNLYEVFANGHAYAVVAFETQDKNGSKSLIIVDSIPGRAQ